MSRWILSAGLLVLGAVSAWRTPIAYLPSGSFPELTVRLSLPQEEDLAAITSRYFQPLESSLRSVGEVRDVAGEVDGRGGRWRVRFAPATDVHIKAARIDSELESLRRGLPEGALLSVDPAAWSGGERSMLVFLPAAEAGGRAVDSRLTSALRDLPAVRSVQVSGERNLESRTVARSEAQDLAALRAAVVRAAGPRRIGETPSPGGRSMPVMVGGEPGLLGERAVVSGGSAVTVASAAHLELHLEEPLWQARYGGASGRLLLISREAEASPLALRLSVRALLEARGWSGAEFLVDEAEPLVQMLARLGWGALLAAVVLGVAAALRADSLASRARAALRGAAVVPLAAASAIQAFYLLGVPLDVTTLMALTFGAAAAILLATLREAGPGAGRAGVSLGFAALALPAAVVLVGGSWGAFLIVPARAFAVAVAASCASVFLLPRPPETSGPGGGGPGARAFRFLLRRPWTSLLAGFSVSFGLLSLCGGSLLPRPGTLSPAEADLALRVRFPQGLSAAEASAVMERAEAVLATYPEVLRWWSVFSTRQGSVGVEVRDADKAAARLRALSARLELRMQTLGASVSVIPLAGAGASEPVRFDDSLVEKPGINDLKTSYRWIARSADASRLERLLERLDERFKARYWLRERVVTVPDWQAPRERWLLVPRPGSDAETRGRALAAVMERARQPFARPALALPGVAQPVQVRVQDAAAPAEAGEVQQLRALLGAQSTSEGVRSAAALFDLETDFGSPTLKRQGGSFVLPITLRIEGLPMGRRLDVIEAIHSTLRMPGWPSGVDLELPDLQRAEWSPERARLVAVGSALPLMLLFLAAVRTGSLTVAASTALPPAVALAFLALQLAVNASEPDELSILAIGGALTVVWGLGAEIGAATRAGSLTTLSVAPGYRWLIRRVSGALAASAAWLGLLMVPTLGLDLDRHAWAGALRSAGTVGVVGLGAAFFLLPVLLRTVDRARRYDRRAAGLRAAPMLWQPQHLEGPPSLAARNLNKIYGNGHQALTGIDFEIGPGVVGLLGPNGAGKTTLMRSLCGLLTPTRGQVLFRGVPVGPENLSRFRQLVGFLPQSFNAYEGFTVEAFLDFWGLEIGLLDPRRRRLEIERVLESVDLTEVADRRVRDLSGGMRRRIGIARALLGA
ncbi:MAG: ATP-binding cassette domain-containing protein, partial [Acidobacteriota bacterium]